MDELIPVGLGDDEEGVAAGDDDASAARPGGAKGDGSKAKAPALA